MSIKTADNRTRTGENDMVRIRLPHLIKWSGTIGSVPPPPPSCPLPAFYGKLYNQIISLIREVRKAATKENSLKETK